MSNQRFISTFAGTLDGKGRVCIPAPWRSILAAQETGGVYLCPTLEGGSLDGFGQVLMDSECQRLDAMDPFLSEMHDAIASQISAESMLLPIDENGRVRLPENFIAAAGLKDKVVFVGLGRKFQIWDPDTYAPVKARRLAAARAARASFEAVAKSAESLPVPPVVSAAETGTP
ncbi:MraZ protein [Rhizomicrobium palustre]|uniref:Transcriptional regulator MraZ n=1 Tax=Rhizomicrobium palustre TaxID=189966 RepID=A0A846MWV9_9PROT|nr:MraZ protein [Rhizomicrobium palustre]